MEEVAITLTFGDCAENHVGMQKIGERAEHGFNYEDLHAAMERFENAGYPAELVHLNKKMTIKCEAGSEVEDAYILIIHNGINALLALGDTASGIIDKPMNAQSTDTQVVDTGRFAQELLSEQLALDWDTRARMRGKVVNKRARYNLCYADEGQEPDYEAGKGRIIAYEDLPLTQKLRQALPHFFGEKAEGLQGEGNLYYDPKKTGIGYHGDSERRKVVAVRLGTSIPLCYVWYQNTNPVSNRMEFTLHAGDVYAMSEKATGYDWKKRKITTLRHAAGCEKYIKLKI